jgi:hypothetical protein
MSSLPEAFLTVEGGSTTAMAPAVFGRSMEKPAQRKPDA